MWLGSILIVMHLMMHFFFLYLCVLEVVPPQRSDLVLATHIPYSETNVFIFYRLDVET